MRLSDDLDKWGANNRDMGLLLVRIVLGAVLIFKGYRFLFHTNDITNLVNSSYNQSSWATAFAWIVILANLVGGLFLLIGVLTRITCVVQIPILIGAMLINLQVHTLNSSEWLLAFVTFFLIVYLYIYGSGKYSLSYILLREPLEDDSEDREQYRRRHQRDIHHQH